jgi:hypothetical protein
MRAHGVTTRIKDHQEPEVRGRRSEARASELRQRQNTTSKDRHPSPSLIPAVPQMPSSQITLSEEDIEGDVGAERAE